MRHLLVVKSIHSPPPRGVLRVQSGQPSSQGERTQMVSFYDNNTRVAFIESYFKTLQSGISDNTSGDVEYLTVNFVREVEGYYGAG